MVDNLFRKPIIHTEDNPACNKWEVPDVKNNRTISNALNEKEIKKLKQQIEKEKDKGRQQGFDEGMQLGFQEGKKSGEKQYQQHIEQAKKIISSIEISAKNLLHDYEQQIIDLALGIAKSVIRKEISACQEGLIALIKEAIAALPPNTLKIQVVLNTKDNKKLQEWLQENKETDLQHIEFKEDNAITLGGCLIKSEHSFIDATVEKRIQDIIEQINGVSGS